MRTKEIGLIGITFAIALVLLAGSAAAQTNETNETNQTNITDIIQTFNFSAGITPDSFLYFFDTLGEQIQLALTFDPVAKTQLLIQMANERVAEAQVMAEAGKNASMQIALQGYDAAVAQIAQQTAAAQQTLSAVAEGNVTMQQLLAQVGNATAQQAAVLGNLTQQVGAQISAEAQSALNQSIETATALKNQAEQALINITGQIEAQLPPIEIPNVSLNVSNITELVNIS